MEMDGSCGSALNMNQLRTRVLFQLRILKLSVLGDCRDIVCAKEWHHKSISILMINPLYTVKSV